MSQARDLVTLSFGCWCRSLPWPGLPFPGLCSCTDVTCVDLGSRISPAWAERHRDVSVWLCSPPGGKKRVLDWRTYGCVCDLVLTSHSGDAQRDCLSFLL